MCARRASFEYPCMLARCCLYYCYYFFILTRKSICYGRLEHWNSNTWAEAYCVFVVVVVLFCSICVCRSRKYKITDEISAYWLPVVQNVYTYLFFSGDVQSSLILFNWNWDEAISHDWLILLDFFTIGLFIAAGFYTYDKNIRVNVKNVTPSITRIKSSMYYKASPQWTGAIADSILRVLGLIYLECKWYFDTLTM